MRTLWRFIAGFFKWTWRLLNFVREMVLNLFFIFLVLVGVGFGCRSVVVIRKKR